MTDQLPYTYTDDDGVAIRVGRLVCTVYDRPGRTSAGFYTPTGEDAVAMACAVLAAAGDTGHRVVSQAEVEALQHRPEDRCYYCATDAEMTAAMESRPHPTIHMNLPEGACSQVRATDALDAQLPDCNGDVVNDIRVALSQRTDLTDEHRAFYSEIVNRFDGLAADRDGLRLTRDRYRDERNTARAELADALRWGRILEAQRADLRQELRAESARVSQARDERDQALQAARSTRDRIAEWLEEVGSAWEGAHVRAMTLLPASSDQTGDALPAEDLVEPGDEVPDLAELHDLVERLALDQAVTQRLAVVETHLGITDEDTETPAQYRDRHGDLWEERPNGTLATIAVSPDFPGDLGITLSRAIADRQYGPLTPVTAVEPPAPCEVCGRASDEQEHGPDGRCRHTPATRLGRPTT